MGCMQRPPTHPPSGASLRQAQGGHARGAWQAAGRGVARRRLGSSVHAGLVEGHQHAGGVLQCSPRRISCGHVVNTPLRWVLPLHHR